MRSPACVAVVIAAAVTFVPAAGQSTTFPSRELEALFAGLHARGLFDGAVVVGDARGVFSQGFGEADAARHVPFTPDTPTDGASLAKTFTAALLIGLEEDGILDLDAPAQRVLPELPYRNITLRHLLSHTSGLPVSDYDYFEPYLPRDQVRTTETLLHVLAAQKPSLASSPGTSFEYSSFGYDVAALAAARAAGKSYADLLRERVFRPLGITSAFVRPGRLIDFPDPRTLGYRRVGARLEVNDVFDLEGFHGGSNVYISARDLHKWNMSFVEAPVLRPAALRRALEPARVGQGKSALTLGSWYHSSDGGTFWYSGHLQAFHSEVFRNIKAGVSIVYVSNNTIEPWLQKGIVRAVSAVLADRTHPDIAAPATQPLEDADRGLLAGRWRMPDGDSLVIAQSGSALFVERGGVRYRIVRISPQAFYVPGLDFVLGVRRGSNSALATIHVDSNVGEQWASRRP